MTLLPGEFQLCEQKLPFEGSYLMRLTLLCVLSCSHSLCPRSAGRQECADLLKPKQSHIHVHKGLGFHPVKDKQRRVVGGSVPRHQANFEGLRSKVCPWLAGQTTFPAGFFLQQIGVLPPAHTVPKGFQIKRFRLFTILPQRLNQSYEILLLLTFMKKHTEINTLDNSQ